jgi:hypothetical protein
MTQPTNPSPIRPAGTAAPATSSVTRHAVTIVVAVIALLAFAFSFANTWMLGVRLGAPPFLAPLVGPAVDLSVVALLVGVREAALRGTPREHLRPARCLLAFCGLTALALNVSEPVTTGAYGRAVYDAVCPVLLICWSEVAPMMLTPDERRPAPAHPEPERPPRLDTLIDRARELDRQHRERHDRPISAETLRRRLGVGSTRARALVAEVRAVRGASTEDRPMGGLVSSAGAL